VPTGEVTQALARLVGAWVEERKARGAGYRFQDFCLEKGEEELQALATGRVLAEERAARVVLRVFGTLLELSGGADHLELEGGTVREVLEAAGRQFPALVQAVLTPEGEVSPAVNVYLGEEDIRSLAGLETPVGPGQEVVLLPAMSGGSGVPPLWLAAAGADSPGSGPGDPVRDPPWGRGFGGGGSR
jgi:molybdopterin converting factor small subunit